MNAVSIGMFYGISIMSMEHNEEIDIIMGVIINRDSGCVLAFHTVGNKLLSLMDIKEIQADYVLIESSNELLDDTEYPLLQPYLEPHTELLGLPVYTNNTYLGRISEAHIDIYTGYMNDVTVRSGHLFWAKEFMYTRDKIVKIDVDKMIIDTDTIEKIPIHTTIIKKA